MKLSIILPVYNVEKYIERCILSVEKQDISKDDYEVIIVDDGSQDASVDIAEKLSKRFPNIVICHKPNGGLSSARNFGMKFAKGEYIWFIDSDDYIEENVLNRLLDKLYTDKLDLLLFNIFDIWPDKECSGFVVEEQPDKVISGREYIGHYDIGKSAWCFIVKRSIVLNNNILFTEGIIHEDYEFTLRLYGYIERMAFIPLRVYNYFHREGSITTIKSEKQIMKSIHSWQTIIKNETELFGDETVYSKAAKVLVDEHKLKGLCVLLFNVLALNVKLDEYRKFKEIGAFDMHNAQPKGLKEKLLYNIVRRKAIYYILIHFFRTKR